ncbi:antimicrobial response protein [Lithospermum erythrorhizon]|uniref:Antimicrobial response protein n=1 Tax=Lithospermum erythrorhizon TaxID=34254 RepID=A0AAV3RA16_LITER
MAGVGKTTLALNLYKTSSVVHHFDLQAWCTVSQNYQKRELMLTILDQVRADSMDAKKLDDEDLADMLCRSLKQGRYLIVIDDIWDVDAWNYLKRCFPKGKQGSRILVTTRYAKVASEIKSKVYTLMGLTKDESWELLHQKISNKGGIPKNLLSIAKEISDSCKGLPLSIVVTAGILSEIEASEHKWNQIAESIVSHILDDVHSQCKAILELSYSYLPDHLQSCFLYFGVFPEDMEISVSQLITLWIAEGFVQDYETNSLEDVAKKYVVDLITRSLVIFSKERSLGGVKTCRVHDLLHEFCKEKTKETYCGECVCLCV